MKTPQKTISFRDVSTLSMVGGKEKDISFVIHDGILKQWIAIGWIDVRQATPADYKKYPVVV